MDTDKKRLYNALDVGFFLFVEDEFMFNEEEDEAKAHVLIDFARMDAEDRMALLNCIPEETPGKKELQEYADKADSWIFGIDWANVPLDDAERILEGRPDILALYQAVPESVWKGEYQQVFFRYGVGVVIQDIFKPLFWDVIRPLPRYLPTRIYKTYTEEIRVSLMQDLETCKDLGKSAALVLDNKVGDARLAEQMIEDLKARDKYPDFYKTASDLKTTKPLIDISHYQERDTVLDYGIKRISRLKKTASLYLYKMFLEYRGRMPYTTINLTGYSIVTAMIKSEEKEHLTTVHIKLTSKRNTNQKDRTRLTWYVKREELQEAINAIVDGSLILESDDEYIELQGKGEIELSCGAASVILKKQIKDDMYTIDVNLKSIGEA